MQPVIWGRANECSGALPRVVRADNRQSTRSRHGQLGQSLVEFALCLSVLVMILLGVLDLGRAFNAYVIITNAAREGARYGSMHPADSSGIVQRVVGEAQGSGITITAANVAVSCTGAGGTPIRVTVRYAFRLFWLSVLGQSTLWLESSAQMVVF